MNLQWLGHACFRVEADDYVIVLDPYADGMVPGLAPLNTWADEVLCSHGHDDHGYTKAVRLRGDGRPSPFTVRRVLCAHDDCGGGKRGMNTIHVLEAGGVSVAHLGDVGCALDGAQLAAIGRVDAALIPVGGYYTIDAVQAKALADALRANVIIPMHYRSEAFGFPVLATVDEFTALCGNVCFLEGDSVDIVAGIPTQTLVPRYMG